MRRRYWAILHASSVGYEWLGTVSIDIHIGINFLTHHLNFKLSNSSLRTENRWAPHNPRRILRQCLIVYTYDQARSGISSTSLLESYVQKTYNVTLQDLTILHDVGSQIILRDYTGWVNVTSMTGLFSVLFLTTSPEFVFYGCAAYHVIMFALEMLRRKIGAINIGWVDVTLLRDIVSVNASYVQEKL